MVEVTIRKIEELEPEEMAELVAESQQDGFDFVKRLLDEYTSGSNRFDKPGEVLFGAYDQNILVGIGGLNQDAGTASRDIGRVRRVYVTRQYRRFGIGRMLLENIIREARPHYQELVLRTNNPLADEFYRSLGFRAEARYTNTTHYIELANLP